MREKAQLVDGWSLVRIRDAHPRARWQVPSDDISSLSVPALVPRWYLAGIGRRWLWLMTAELLHASLHALLPRRYRQPR